MKKRREYQGTRSVSRDVNEFFGKSPYKSNVDDRPKRVPKDRNTGTSVERRLRGKVIG
ncbi:hypothetical protein B0G75_104267 [Paraburkholderia sp. BL18I3N2]|uniref:hypothetical protein n=1 Tax=Paraburkholderia sp. BL18I3N2 TaxID=1938799 RepID=UPI000D45769F|nr:hypothetical protein [Paraburkholderia sp. BL18I3N2]PRX32246.1 hypothetical protein B0G75_104267 [Paraburkholderia sp. BL18I3N2]